MSLFGKKKEEIMCNSEISVKAKADCPNIKVLGSGCVKCNQLEAAAKEALKQLGMDTAIEHVTDFSQIAAYGVMSTPALVIDTISLTNKLIKDLLFHLY